MDKNLPNVSVIVLSSNNAGISIVINSIISQLDVDDEIIIVDDHSKKSIIDELHLFRHNNLIIINSSVKGNRSLNRNLGASEANNDILIFIDGDMVLDSFAINEFKIAHKNRIECAFVGQTHATRYSEDALYFYSGLDNYLDIISSDKGKKSIFNNKMFTDKRVTFFAKKELIEYYWLLYFSGVCSVEKNIFIEVGGFDESFTHWGAEDVDLGYRISKIGKIGFIENAHSLHIPHKRDIFEIEKSNKLNIEKLYNKYQTWEWELLNSFRITPDLLNSVITIKRQLELIDFDNITDFNDNDSVVINVISKSNPNGLIKYSFENTMYCKNCIGISLAFLPKKYKNIYISENIFVYPNFLFCRILQQSLKYANNVYIVNSNTSIRITDFSRFNSLYFQPQLKTEYVSNDIMEFNFEKLNDMLTKVTSKIDFTQSFRLKTFWKP